MSKRTTVVRRMSCWKALATVVAVLGLTLTAAGSAFATAPPNPTQVGATTLSNIQLNGVPGTVLTVAPGANVTISANWSDSNSGCPGCIDFLTVGWPGQNFAGCIENSGGDGASGSGAVYLGPAPTAGGTYDIVADFEEVYYCGEYWNNGGSVNYQVIAQVVVPSPPTASITTPVSGATYAQGSVVYSAFTCTEGAGGPGISTCLDNNNQPSGATLNTSVLGTFTYTVTATSLDGQTGTATVNYTVANPPAATITTPVNGATYSINDVVTTNFTCTEGANGPGIKSCLDNNNQASGGTLNTSVLGTHTFGVIATSNDGLTGTASVTYDVVAGGVTASAQLRLSISP